MLRRSPRSTLFPYTTFFRSAHSRRTLHRPRRRRTRGPRENSFAADARWPADRFSDRSEEHTSELQSHSDLVCRLLLEKKKRTIATPPHRYLKPTLLQTLPFA